MPTPELALQPDARQALILSGGGAQGAFEIGVTKALFEGASPATGGRPLKPQVFTGNSVGSYNAAFLVQEGEPGLEAVRRLEEVWLRRIADTPESCGNGVYRLRGDPSRFLEPGCWGQPFTNLAEVGGDIAFWSGYALAYGTQFFRSDASLRIRLLEAFNLAALFSREPLEALLRETIDLRRLRASPSALAVSTSDWQNGRAVVFYKDQITSRLGTDAILASTAIPGVFPPVYLDGTPYVDGGILMNTPLRPAVTLGANVLHAIYLDPKVSAIPYPPLPNTLDTLYRFYAVLLAEQFNQDVRHAAIINEEILSLLGTTAARGRDLPAVRARRATAVEARTGALSSPDKVYRPLEIHRYRPKTALGGTEDMLNFSLEHVANLIEMGYQNAVHHDCGEAQCALPSQVRPATR